MAGVVNQDHAYWKRRAFAGARRAGLNRSERLEIAEMLLKRDVTSFDALEIDELRRMCDAFEGHWFVSVLLEQRHPASKS